MSKYCIENDVYGLATFVTLSRHTCLCDIKACGVTFAGSKLSQSHSTARVTSRGQATVPTQNFKRMGFFSAMTPLDSVSQTGLLFKVLLPTAALSWCFQEVHSGPGLFPESSLVEPSFRTDLRGEGAGSLHAQDIVPKVIHWQSHLRDLPLTPGS